MSQYLTWIAAHQPTDPRGQCANVTKKMVKAFPELRRVRGHYICPLEGRRPHWWLVTPAGSVVDPTAEQFASCGAGDYEEYTGPEPTGHCLNCGALLYHAVESMPFCDAKCGAETVEFVKSGGSIFVNGQQVL